VHGIACRSVKNQPEVLLNSRSLDLFFTIFHLSEEDQSKCSMVDERYINLEKFFKDLFVLKEKLNEFTIINSSMSGATCRSCIMFYFDTPSTESYEFFKLEEKRISDYF
jgi:hypothetical protein